MTSGHWDQVYQARAEGERSWTELQPATSLQLLEGVGVGSGTRILDVGGGASRLVDRLLAEGGTPWQVGVLDVSLVALDETRERLGAQASRRVEWIHGSVLDYRADEPWDVWHDRASLHFFTEPGEVASYRDSLLANLAPGGRAILAAFHLDGPESCSGLQVQRYDAAGLAAVVGAGFVLEESVEEVHVTPDGGRQPFVYARFRRVGRTARAGHLAQSSPGLSSPPG